MTAKEYLSTYRKYMSDIVFYETLKEGAIRDIASLRSPSFDERIKSNPQKDPIGDLIVKLQKDLAKYDVEIVKCKVKMALIESQVDKIKDKSEDCYKLLVYKYILGLSWDDIAEKMINSKSFVTHLHAPALNIFCELFCDSYEHDS